MNQESNAISGSSSTLLGRIYWTARSLMPDSGFVGWAIGSSFLVSFFAFAYWEFPALFMMFAMACAMGLGHMTCLYQNSERRRLVPWMNSTCAAVAIAITFGLWLLSVAMNTYQYGMVPEGIGGSLLFIGFGLWVGWGERRIFHVLGLLFLILLAVMVTPNGPTRIYEFYLTLSLGVRSWIGLGIGLIGLGMLWRFWSLVTIKISPGSFKQQKDIFSYLTTPFLEREDSANDIWDVNESSQPGVLPVTLPSNLAGRLQWMIYGRTYWNGFHYFWGMLSLLMIGMMLIAARGHDEATSGFTCLAFAILIVVPTVMFLIRVPQSFGRLWLAGVSESRTKTARHMLTLTARRTVPVFVMAFALLLLNAPYSPQWYAVILFMLMGGLCAGGLSLWVTARWYVFWSRKRPLGFICYIVFGVAMILSMLPLASVLVPNVIETLTSFGWVPSLVGMTVLTTLVWVGCIYDASNALGRSRRLGECQITPQAISVFSTDLE